MRERLPTFSQVLSEIARIVAKTHTHTCRSCCPSGNGFPSTPAEVASDDEGGAAAREPGALAQAELPKAPAPHPATDNSATQDPGPESHDDVGVIAAFKSQTLWAFAGAAIPGVLIVGALATAGVTATRASVLAIPRDFVPSSALEGALAFGLGLTTTIGSLIIAYGCWRWAWRGGIGHAGTAIVAPLVVGVGAWRLSLALYSGGDITGAAQLQLFAAVALAVAGATCATLVGRGLWHGIARVRARWQTRARPGRFSGVLVRPLQGWRSSALKARGTSLWSPKPSMTRREVSAVALASAFMLVPMAVGTWAFIIYLIPAVTFSSTSVDGVSPTGAFVSRAEVGSNPEMLPAAFSLYFIKDGVVLQRPVGRSKSDAALYVPCGNSLITSLDGLSLYELPDSVAFAMDVGSTGRPDRPAGCDEASND